MHAHLTIPRRFCGPPESANGGYTAGSLARYVDGDAEVMLRRPPPLERPLTVERVDGGVHLLDDDTVIADAIPTTVTIDPPAPVAFDVAARAGAASAIARHPEMHPFPTCFVCGPGRSAADGGLRVFPGPVAGTESLAAAWIPDANDDEIVWGVLDCASSAGLYRDFCDQPPPPHVLGRIAAHLVARPRAGEPHVVMSWAIGRDGRKFFGGSAIYGPDARLCAVARATWIALNAP